jgi:hypothetical protein
MSTRELIEKELDHLPQRELDQLLTYLNELKAHADSASLLLAAESSLRKDWLSPDEDAAWASL